ncbi:MAG: hypothetical protein QXV83_02760 [Candidatus Anstonellaceae archaeon]
MVYDIHPGYEYELQKKQEQEKIEKIQKYQRISPPVEINSIEQSRGQLEYAKNAYEWAKEAYLRRAQNLKKDIQNKIALLEGRIATAERQIGIMDRGFSIPTDVIELPELRKELEIYKKSLKDISESKFSPEIIYVSHKSLYGEKIDFNFAIGLYKEYELFQEEYKEIKNKLNFLQQNIENIKKDLSKNVTNSRYYLSFNKDEKNKFINDMIESIRLSAQLSVAKLFSKFFVANYILNSPHYCKANNKFTEDSEQKKLYIELVKSIKLVSYYQVIRALNYKLSDLKEELNNYTKKDTEKLLKIFENDNKDEFLFNYNIDGANALIEKYEKLIYYKSNKELLDLWGEFQEGILTFSEKTIQKFIFDKKLSQNFFGTLIEEYGDLALTVTLVSLGVFTGGIVSTISLGALAGYEIYKGTKEIVHGIKEKSSDKIKEGIISLGAGALVGGSTALKLAKNTKIIELIKKVEKTLMDLVVAPYGGSIFFGNAVEVFERTKDYKYGFTHEDFKNLVSTGVMTIFAIYGSKNTIPKKIPKNKLPEGHFKHSSHSKHFAEVIEKNISIKHASHSSHSFNEKNIAEKIPNQTEQNIAWINETDIQSNQTNVTSSFVLDKNKNKQKNQNIVRVKKKRKVRKN